MSRRPERRRWLLLAGCGALLALACQLPHLEPAPPFRVRMVLTYNLDRVYPSSGLYAYARLYPQDEPAGDLERVKRSDGRFVIWTRWEKVPLGPHHVRVETVLPDGRVEAEEIDVPYYPSGAFTYWTSYRLDPEAPTGSYRIRALLDGEIAVERSLEVTGG